MLRDRWLQQAEAFSEISERTRSAAVNIQCLPVTKIEIVSLDLR